MHSEQRIEQQQKKNFREMNLNHSLFRLCKTMITQEIPPENGEHSTLLFQWQYGFLFYFIYFGFPLRPSRWSERI
jgi:hypothetical protein